MHKLVGPTGLIIGIDHLPGLVEMSKNNLAADGVSVSVSEQQEMGARTKTKSGDADGGKVSGETGVKIVLGDGREGYAPSGQSLLISGFGIIMTLSKPCSFALTIIVPYPSSPFNYDTLKQLHTRPST
jgi:hypothetical protein